MANVPSLLPHFLPMSLSQLSTCPRDTVPGSVRLLLEGDNSDPAGDRGILGSQLCGCSLASGKREQKPKDVLRPHSTSSKVI